MYCISFCILTFATACMLSRPFVAGSEVKVTTNLGDVIGKRVSVDGRDALQFLKIPFAQPPINNRRFKKPVAVTKWTEALNATRYGPSCSQNHLGDNLRFIRDKNVETSEDCLHLNIYVPGKDISSTKKLAVLVWIHGGSFIWGQAMRNDGSRLALGGDVIVVTVNYRLGVFGFLSTGDARLRGNYGLWDMNMALKWINSNIGSFGGESSQVAVFGQSAGGWAVSALVISPVNKGLFSKAIIMSGPLYSPFALSNSTRVWKYSHRIIEALNCTGDGTDSTSEFTMGCLRKVDEKTVVDVVDTMFVPDRFELFTSILGPVVDFDFVPDTVNKMLTNKNSEAYKWFTSLDLIIGDTDSEGSLLYYDLAGFQKMFNFSITAGIPRRVLCNYVIPAVVRDYYSNTKKISEEMCTLYSTNDENSDEQSQMAISFYTDFMFWAPTLKMINAHIASDEPAFMYLFSHQVRYGLTPYRTDTVMPWIRGANHADDVYILFGPEYVYPKNTEVDETDKNLSAAMMQYWANFAKYGNPNGEPNSNPSLVQWPEYDEKEKYLNINSSITVQTSIFPRRMKFWLQRIPEIMKEVTSGANVIEALIHVNSYALVAYVLICIKISL